MYIYIYFFNAILSEQFQNPINRKVEPGQIDTCTRTHKYMTVHFPT